MRILTWNIQSGLGCDGVRAMHRLCDYIKELDSPEVICLQEISRNIDEYSVPGQEDQLEMLRKHFPEYSFFWGSATKIVAGDGTIQEFGNVSFSRLPVSLYRTHLLPQPPANGALQIGRSAVEILVPWQKTHIRIINTHLAYHIISERRLQLEYFVHLQRWAEESCTKRPKVGRGPYAHHIFSPNSILCGDCNFTPDSEDYRFLSKHCWLDSWRLLHPESPHAPTCGIFDHEIWPEGPHCRDYFWIRPSSNLELNDIMIDAEIDYSDHQPVILSLRP